MLWAEISGQIHHITYYLLYVILYCNYQACKGGAAQLYIVQLLMGTVYLVQFMIAYGELGQKQGVCQKLLISSPLPYLFHLLLVFSGAEQGIGIPGQLLVRTGTLCLQHTGQAERGNRWDLFWQSKPRGGGRAAILYETRDSCD